MELINKTVTETIYDIKLTKREVEILDFILGSFLFKDLIDFQKQEQLDLYQQFNKLLND